MPCCPSTYFASHTIFATEQRRLNIGLTSCALLIPVIFILLNNGAKPKGELEVELPTVSFPESVIEFARTPIGDTPTRGQLITNITFADVNLDNAIDVIACDALRGEVYWYENAGQTQFVKHLMNTESLIPCPSHVTALDLDRDGDQDFLVTSLGRIQPTNEEVGRLVWLRNDGNEFKQIEVLSGIRRTTDVQGGDFDSDGDIDLVVAVFGGPLQGEILYLENDGKQNFTDYVMLAVSGTIHVPVADFDGDGDLDVVANVTQDDEEVLAFVNDGTGFKKPGIRKRLYASWNYDLGGAGMIKSDLDQDGDQDLLLSLGDNLELMHNYPQPWHGCLYLENKGNWEFSPKQIANVGGVYGAATADIDNDGDTDVALVSMFNDWAQENSASVVWLENDGSQNFKTYQIASDPIQLATVGCADLDQDGSVEIVTGSFHFRQPFDRFGSVDIFSRSKGESGE